MAKNDNGIVLIRRQWNDWRDARYRGLHWTSVSGGVNAPAPGLSSMDMCGMTR
jgi:hypothetical protein